MTIKILLQTVMPVFLVIAIGYLFNYFFNIKVKELSRVYLYILAPALVFKSIIDSTIESREAVFIVLSIIILIFSLLLIVVFISKLNNWEENTATAVKLGTIFMNPGNIGLPLILFSFGSEGVDIGVIFLLVQAIIHYSLGVFIASKGTDVIKGIKEVFRLPFPYVAIIALKIRFFSIPMPTFLYEGIDFISESAIPLSTLVLGMLLTQVNFKTSQFKLISFVTVVRLIISPILMFLILKLFPISLFSIKILILLTATPSSLNSVIIATQYEAEPEFVSSINISTTLVSLITLPLVIYFLG